MSKKVPRGEVAVVVFGVLYSVDAPRLRSLVRRAVSARRPEMEALRRAVEEALDSGASYRELREAVRSVSCGTSGRSGRSATEPSRARAARAAKRPS